LRRRERPEHGRLGRGGRERIHECVDEHRETEGVRPEDELLAPVVRDPARLGQNPDALVPLALGQSDLRRERVEMTSEALGERPRTLIRTPLERGDGRRRNVVLRDALAGARAAQTGGSGSYWI
jgi:hypothetical protein